MQVIRDGELLKLVIECEEMDYQSKRTYDTDARPDWERWVKEAEEGFAEEATTYGHEQAIEPMLVCFRRFLVPFRKMASIRREDFTEQTLSSQAFRWAYDVTRVRKGVLTIVATNGQQQVNLEYQTTINHAERNVVIHTSIRMGDKHTVQKGFFSYKKDAKMHTVRPWQEAQKAIHAQACDTLGIPSEPATTAFDKAMVIVWEGVTEAMEVRHEKKTKKKDEVDGRLFDMESE